MKDAPKNRRILLLCQYLEGYKWVEGHFVGNRPSWPNGSYERWEPWCGSVKIHCTEGLNPIGWLERPETLGIDEGKI